MFVSPAAASYIERLIAATKLVPAKEACAVLTRLSSYRAAFDKREFVTPEDIKEMFPYVLGRDGAATEAGTILSTVPILTA
jgi:MoxR-like ATPase